MLVDMKPRIEIWDGHDDPSFADYSPSKEEKEILKVFEPITHEVGVSISRPMVRVFQMWLKKEFVTEVMDNLSQLPNLYPHLFDNLFVNFIKCYGEHSAEPMMKFVEQLPNYQQITSARFNFKPDRDELETILRSADHLNFLEIYYGSSRDCFDIFDIETNTAKHLLLKISICENPIVPKVCCDKYYKKYGEHTKEELCQCPEEFLLNEKLFVKSDIPRLQELAQKSKIQTIVLDFDSYGKFTYNN